jgi:hypothetical protein
VKTSARFHTSLFRSLLRGLRAFRIGKIAKNLAPLDPLQNFAEFSHSLGRFRLSDRPMGGREIHPRAVEPLKRQRDKRRRRLLRKTFYSNLLTDSRNLVDNDPSLNEERLTPPDKKRPHPPRMAKRKG